MIHHTQTSTKIFAKTHEEICDSPRVNC